MKLQNLTLNNFQGTTFFGMDLKGKSVNIFGDNETGKTTIANAYSWLLFDRPFTGIKNFTPKTRIGEDDAHYLEHVVEGVFEDENGTIITLKKSYHEVYSTVRGTGVEKFNGHTTDYFVDGVPKSMKEYELVVMNLIRSAEVAKMLTSPHYFSLETAWLDRRKYLFDICGDLTDQEIMKDNVELHALVKFLVVPGAEGKYMSVEDYKKIASSRESVLNAEIKKIPTRIDEANKAIPEISKTLDELNSEIKTLRDNQHTLEIEMMSASDGSSKHTKLKKDLENAKLKYTEEKNKFDAAQSDVRASIRTKIDGFQDQLTAERGAQSMLRSDIHSAEQEIERLNKQRTALVLKYKQVEASTWDTTKEMCPTCDQALPVDKIEELKSNFNISRSKELEELNATGQKECSSDMISALRSTLEVKKMSLNNTEVAIKGFEDAIKSLQSELDSLPKFESTEICLDIQAAITSCETRLKFADSESEDLKTPLKLQISELETQIEALKTEKLKFETKATQENRIVELQDELKKYTAEYQEIQKGLYLCEQFIRVKASMLDQKINSHFKNVKFRLFVDQINGGLKEDCEVLVPSKEGNLVPYPMANSAGQINAGLEIIEVLSQHFKAKLPIIIDNAESVTNLYSIDTQVIRLIVSENHKTLDLEVVNNG